MFPNLNFIMVVSIIMVNYHFNIFAAVYNL